MNSHVFVTLFHQHFNESLFQCRFTLVRMLLKAILYGFGVDFSKTHGLKGLFEKLPQNEQEYISKNIAIENREKEFYLYLQEY